MCSHFLKRMENYQGDLADILRANKTTSDSSSVDALPEWQFSNNPVNFSDPVEDFGDPFTLLGDPLLHDIDTPVSGFFHNSSNTIIKARGENSNDKMIDHDQEMMIRPSNNIFSRMLQVSPNPKLTVPPCDSTTVSLSSSKLVTNDLTLISPSGSKGSLVQSPGGLQISSPRNPGIKRRKSQAKKVVCIPAPAPANSRSSGEVVPSDLWAWRKYGQKPIKGSPYPRGYYRCSSSKGCSARKQVERSRTDPNMLVITYTSEHNHPWPTQRNSLAGSTRSHQATKLTNSSKNPPNSQTQKPSNPKEEHKDIDPNTVTMKQEMDLDTNDQLEMNDTKFDEEFPTSYKPALPDNSGHSEDNFFADLGEIDADPLELLFSTQGFSVGDNDRENKTLDPFSFYDWPGNNNSTTTSATTSYGDQPKRDS